MKIMEWMKMVKFQFQWFQSLINRISRSKSIVLQLIWKRGNNLIKFIEDLIVLYLMEFKILFIVKKIHKKISLLNKYKLLENKT